MTPVITFGELVRACVVSFALGAVSATVVVLYLETKGRAKRQKEKK